MENFLQNEILMLGVLAVAIGVVIYVLTIPFLSGEKKAARRVQQVASTRTASAKTKSVAAQTNKRKAQLQKVLDELDNQKKEQAAVTPYLRIERAGLKMEPLQLTLIFLLLGAASSAGIVLYFGNFILATVSFFVVAFGLKRWWLNFLTKRRQSKFLNEFANAIDVIVRGVRSGLALNDCLQIISEEIPDPVGSEFNYLNEQLRIGVPVDAAFEKMYHRIPVQEVNFFSIVIAIQSKSGGNLAEALSNLSGVLRDRRRLQQKVAAYSSEAKSSAMIIGSLPIVVMGLVYMSTPDYITMLFTEQTGHFLLGVSAALMLTGTLVMRKMINFEY